jgi:hypothetical protein
VPRSPPCPIWRGVAEHRGETARGVVNGQNGILKVSGVDVGPVMIAEGFAEKYVCDATRCPPRRNWCRLGR